MEESGKKEKQTILSGIQPTGVFTLGNYIGAIRNWGKMQEEYDCAYFVADLHSLTVRQDPAALRKQSLDAFALLLSCGIDPEKSLIFIQSHVPAHAELSWILSCYTQFGELSRMTQFKDKSAKHADNVNAGLFTYPALMAADILLYQADLVPVGADQKQHLEFTRDVATRFNNLYGGAFKIPEPYISQTGAKIMSLQEPGKDGINNLITIYSILTGKTVAQVEQEFAGKGYGDFKLAVGEVVADKLAPVRENFKRYSADRAYLEQVYRAGADRAAAISARTLAKVKKKVGLAAR